MKLGHTFIGSEHILYGLVSGKYSAAALLLARHGVKEKDTETRIEKAMGRGVATRLTVRDFSPRGKRILEKAVDFSRQDGRSCAGTEYILLAILSEEDCCGFSLLREMGVNTEKLVKDIRGQAR